MKVTIKQIMAHVIYTLRHKWYVMVECFKVKLYWQGIVHDWDKFLPSSLVGYGETFFNPDGTRKVIHNSSGHYDPAISGTSTFKLSYLRHTRINKHHWQYWVLQKDCVQKTVFEIPHKYILEMVCDWKGASRALGVASVQSWWDANNNKILLHNVVREKINKILKNA